MPKTTLFNTFAIEDLSLRDYFAAKAMQGFMNDCYDLSNSERAHLAYLMADEMIKARKQNG